MFMRSCKASLGLNEIGDLKPSCCNKLSCCKWRVYLSLSPANQQRGRFERAPTYLDCAFVLAIIDREVSLS